MLCLAMKPIWQVVASILLGLFGWGPDKSFPIVPAAVGYVAMSASIIALTAILWRQRKEVGEWLANPIGNGQLHPDFPIRELFFHIDPHVIDDVQGNRSRWDNVGNSVLGLLSSGQLHSWGELEGSSSPRLVPIPQSSWEEAEFTFVFFEEGLAYRQKVHAHGSLREGNSSYRNVMFDEKEVVSILPKPALFDRELIITFLVPVVLLAILATAMGYPQLRKWAYIGPRPIPEGALLIGKLNLQQGPQISNGALLIQFELKNSLATALKFEATSIRFVFNGVELIPSSNSVIGTLAGSESVNFRFPLVPKRLFNTQVHQFELRFAVLYGPSESSYQWRVERSMKCRVLFNNFNDGNCTYSLYDTKPET